MTQGSAVPERPPLAIVVAANVYRLRKDRGLSQEKLAQRAELSREVVRLLETSRLAELGRGGLRLETVERLAAALEVDASALLEWDPGALRVFIHAKARRSRLLAVPSGTVLDNEGNLLAPLPAI